MLKKITLILSTFCLAACEREINVGIPAPPAERLSCQEMPPAPNIAPLVAFMVPEGMPVYQKRKVDERDALLAAWILAIRDAHFSCYDDVTWLAEYYDSQ
jgi:hypothetical protein